MKNFFWISTYLKKLLTQLVPPLAISITASLFIAVAQSSSVIADPLPERINFQHLLENKDIAIGEAQAFLQDSQGFMWIGGGGGLVRYDGYEFKFVLQTVQEQSGPVKKPVKMVFDIYQDSEDVMWIATRTGLLRYDPATELLTPIADDPSAAQTISTTAFWMTVELPSGELLAASSSGLYALDRKTNKYSVIVPDPSKKDWLHNKLVKKVYLDQAGTLWLGTGSGLEKLDWHTKTFILFKPFPENPELVGPNVVNDIISSREGTLWLGTNDGLVNFDPATQKSTRYGGDPKNILGFTGKEIAKLMVDTNGTLWIASDGGGIVVFEKTEQFPSGYFVSHLWAAGKVSGIKSNQVRTVYEDSSGDVWVGTYPEGINYFDRSTNAITTFTHDPLNTNTLSQNAILAVREDVKHNLWIGTDGGGLNFFDRENNKVTIYKSDPDNKNSLSGNSALDVFVAEDGKVWVGTWGGGVSVLDPTTGEFHRMPFNASQKYSTSVWTSKELNDGIVWGIKEDKQKNLWLCTHNGGLSKFDRQTQTYTHYINMENDPTSITFGVVWSIFEDSKGNFWVGTAFGLDLMDRSKGTFKHFRADPQNPKSLSNPSTTALFEDSKHRLWIGTESGLNLLNPDGETFTRYNKDNGFTDDNIRTILEDSQGKLWLATNNGITVFDPETKKVKNYNRDSGRLMGGFHTDSGLISNKGEIIFGGVKGLRIFDPKKLTENKVVPPIAFTDLKIFADSVNVGDPNGLLVKSLNHTSTIVLDHKKTMFQFGFAALNFRDSNKNSYAYMLEGFDKNWLQVGDQRSAKYTNLNSGTYNFRVKGSNNDGTWNEEGTSITIIQLPPPWKTWWAYTLYTLSFIAIVILFIHSQRKKRRLVEEQNRLLEIKVFERTAELREKNKDIQSMLSNMRQGLFTIETTGNIHPEYSRFLQEIFETKNIEGQNALALLFGKANLGSDTSDQIKEAINSIIGENQINFTFNSHLLIEEYETDFNGKSKFLSLDWNPVLDDEVVSKLMVSVRDVTLLKKMESDALSKKRELDIISQLLNVPAKKYLGFALSAKRFISENRTQLERNEQGSDTVIALLFRNMHTLKGNCRTFDFSHFSDVVHDVESVYSTLISNSHTYWNRDKLLTDLARVEDVLQEYEQVYYNVLRRGESANEQRDQNGFWADSKAIEIIQHYIDATKQQFSINDQSALPIQSLLNRALTSPINEVLADILSSLPSIAIQLNKEMPKVIIEDNQVRIKSSATELMTDIFAHILRNSIDHGIETAEVRIQTGKPSAGTIHIRAIPQQEFLHIYVKDDGQGINIDQLFKKGIDIGKWKAEDNPSYSDIANLIFVSGISTKEQVTNISGRGVGMDAVKEFLLAQGGNISLQLLGTKSAEFTLGQGVMIPFELIIELPDKAFTVMD